MAGMKIIIVDDDKYLLSELQETLNLKGYFTITVNDSITAFDAIFELKPDLILLDLKMEGMNGFQLANKLRRFPSTAHIPIIAMTGIFNKENHFNLMDMCGIKICLEKPFNPLDLIMLIKEINKENKRFKRKRVNIKS